MKKIITFDKNLEFKSMIGEVTSISLDHSLKFVDKSNIEGDFQITGTYKLTEASTIENDFSFSLPVEISLPEKLSLDTTKIEIDDFYYEIENDDTMVCHIDVLVQGVEEIEPEIIEEELTEKSTLEQVDIKEELNDATIKSDDNELIRECDGDEKNKFIVSNEKKMNDTEIKEASLKDEPKLYKKNIQINEEKIETEVKNNMENIEKETIEEVSETEENQNVGSLFSSFSDNDETFTTYSVYIVRNNDTIEQIIDKYKITKEELENYNDLKDFKIGCKIIIPTSNE